MAATGGSSGATDGHDGGSSHAHVGRRHVANYPPTPTSTASSASSASSCGDAVGVSPRERIRAQLAQQQREEKERECKSLQLCFLNEAVYDRETHDEAGEDEDDEDDQEEQEGLADREIVDIDKADQSQSDFSQRPSAVFIARNNISKRKNHVIIPLTPTEQPKGTLASHAAADKKSKRTTPGRGGGGDGFAIYLRQIRQEARERLRRVREEEEEQLRRSRALNGRPPSGLGFIGELERLLGVSVGRRFDRRVLSAMNVAQLQVILNFLLSRVEELNECLVKDLMQRDGLLMEQDGLLTDVEDITKSIGCVKA